MKILKLPKLKQNIYTLRDLIIISKIYVLMLNRVNRIINQNLIELKTVPKWIKISKFTMRLILSSLPMYRLNIPI